MTSRDVLLRAIRTANLFNGLAHRRNSPRIARRAILWAERVNELYEEVPPEERIDLRLPDPGDRRVPAYSVEYPRHFPIRIIGTWKAERETGCTRPTRPELEAFEQRRQWLMARLGL